MDQGGEQLAEINIVTRIVLSSRIVLGERRGRGSCQWEREKIAFRYFCICGSPIKSQRHLHLVRCVGLARNHSERAGVQFQVWIAELSAVEKTEHLCPKIDPLAFGDRKGFRKAHILIESRSGPQPRIVAGFIAEQGGGLCGEGGEVEIFIHIGIEL
jgi:hypothetical protein